VTPLVPPTTVVTPRVALVHEWLVTWGGSESVLQSLAHVYPGAPLHTLLAKPEARTRQALGHLDIRTTWLDKLPAIRRLYRLALPVMPRAWRTHDLSGYDVVLTSSHSMAKSVRVPNGLHICYCHSPPRYLWDLNEEYRAGGAALLRGRILDRLRRQDLEAAAGVDAFVANSHFVAERIRRIYGRRAEVVYPPVDVDDFHVGAGAGTHWLAGGRLVAYKRIDRAVRAANVIGLPLVVFGDGPERARLEALAGPTVRFTGAVDHEALRALLRDARGFVFPGIEDFGILPVEAQAAGKPVVALNRGGARETVVAGETGVLYDEDTVEGLAAAWLRADGSAWDADACRTNALRFSRDRFEHEMRAVVERERARR